MWLVATICIEQLILHLILEVVFSNYLTLQVKKLSLKEAILFAQLPNFLYKNVFLVLSLVIPKVTFVLKSTSSVEIFNFQISRPNSIPYRLVINKTL